MAAMVKGQTFGGAIIVIKGHPRDVYGENLLFDIKVEGLGKEDL